MCIRDRTNTLATSAQETFGIPLIVSGVVLVALSVFIIVRGGVEKIGNFCGKVVPPMCLLYIVGTLVVVIANIANVPEAFGMIFKYAFAPMPAVGGFAGSTLALAMGRGASRGIFSNAVSYTHLDRILAATGPDGQAVQYGGVVPTQASPAMNLLFGVVLPVIIMVAAGQLLMRWMAKKMGGPNACLLYTSDTSCSIFSTSIKDSTSRGAGCPAKR